MKTFFEYLLEDIEFKTERSLLRKLFKQGIKQGIKSAKLTNITSANSTLGPNEIFRGTLGSTDTDVDNNIRTILQHINNKDIHEFGQVSVDNLKCYGRTAGASGTHKSKKFRYKGNTYYITTLGDPGSITDSDLKPQSFNLTEIYDSFDSLRDAILTSSYFINNLSTKFIGKEPSTSYINRLINEINNGKYSYTGCFEKDDSNEFGNSTDSGTCKVAFNNTQITNFVSSITKQEHQIITKNFGEVLGPLVLLKRFNLKPSKTTTSVDFEEDKNSALVDYVLNGTYKISAKAGSGGAKPSGKTAFQNALSVLRNNKNKKIETSEPDEQIKNKLITVIGNSYSMDIFNQQKTLISNYSFPDLRGPLNEITVTLFGEQVTGDIPTILQKMGFNNWSSSGDLVKSVSAAFTTDNESTAAEKAANFISQLHNILKFKSSKWPISAVQNQWEKLVSQRSVSICGLIFYPLYTTAVRNLNTKYGTILSEIISSSVDIKQLYLTLTDHSIILQVQSGQKSAWRLSVGGISVNKATSCGLSIEMQKQTLDIVKKA